MPDHQSVSGAAAAPVRHQRHRVSQPLPQEGPGHTQHLPHPRAAPWTVVADVARSDLPRGHPGHRRLLGGEHPGRTRVLAALVARDLDHGSLRGQRAVQYHHAAGLLQRHLQAPDHALVSNVRVGGPDG